MNAGHFPIGDGKHQGERQSLVSYVRAAFLSTISTVVRIGSGFVLNKVVAVVGGPSGLALVGQLQNFLSIIQSVGTGGIQQGIVKYTAEHHASPATRLGYQRTAASITLICSTVTAGMVCVLARALAVSVLGDPSVTWLIVLSGLLLPLFVLNAFLLSVLNGAGETTEFILITTVQNAAAIILLLPMVKYLGLSGALASLVIGQSAGVFFTLWRLRRLPQISPLRAFLGRFARDEAAQYGKYALMAVTAAVAGPWSQIQVRNLITTHLSVVDAGMWQGMTRISAAYLAVITTMLSVYYLPKLSATKGAVALKHEVLANLRITLLVLLPIFITTYLLRNWVIELLFTPQFLPMRDLFIWQLAADGLRVTAYYFAYILWARGMMRTFVISEVLFTISYVFVVARVVEARSLVLILQAYTGLYLGYLVFAVLVFHWRLRKEAVA